MLYHMLDHNEKKRYAYEKINNKYFIENTNNLDKSTIDIQITKIATKYFILD